MLPRKKYKCEICDSTSFQEIDFSYPFLPTKSRFKDLHVYKNRICLGCGVVSTFPKIPESRLVNFYNSDYRTSEYAIHIGNVKLEPPIQIPWSGMSFRRFKTFYDCYESTIGLPTIDEKTRVLDIGAYQGMFLYALNKTYSAYCVACDYNEKGIEFCKRAFGFLESRVTNNIETEKFSKKFDLVTMVHAFEHLRNPHLFFSNLKENVLSEHGLFYLEIPNAEAYPLDDPTHIHMYTPDSLEATLNRFGFSVLNIGVTGFGCESMIFNSPRQNIYALAKLITPKTSKQLDPFAIYRSIKHKHLKTSIRACFNGFRKVAHPLKQAISNLMKAVT